MGLISTLGFEYNSEECLCTIIGSELGGHNYDYWDSVPQLYRYYIGKLKKGA